MKKGLFLLLICITNATTIYAQPNYYVGADRIFCPGSDPVQLRAPGASAYSWTPSAGLSDTTIIDPLASPSVTTTYYYTSIYTNYSVTDSLTVYVVGSGPIDVLPFNDTTLCNGEPVKLYTSFGDSLSWRVLGSSYNYGTFDTLTLFALDTQVLELEVKRNAACLLRDSITIIGNGPSVIATTTAQSCNANDGTMEVSISGGQTPYNLTWNDGDTSLQRNGLTGGYYGYSVTDANGCEFSATLHIADFLDSLSLAASDETLCKGQSAQIGVGSWGATNINASTTGYALIGNDTSFVNDSLKYPAIYGNFYKSSRHQLLYRASELTAAGVVAGDITSVAFDIARRYGTDTYCNFQIKMGNTALDQLGHNLVTGLTTVYPSTTVQIDTGWNTYPFPTSFQWDGVSNLVVSICFDKTPFTNSNNPTCNTPYTSNSQTRNTTTPFNSVSYIRSDSSPQCNSTSSGWISNLRPNIRFGTSYAGYNFEIDHMQWTNATDLSDSTIVNPSVKPNETTTYVLTLTDTNGCVISDSLTIYVSDLDAQPTSATNYITDCDRDTVSLFANASSNVGIATYAWNGVDQFSPSSSVANNIAKLTLWEESTELNVFVRDSFGCSVQKYVTIERDPGCITTLTGFTYSDDDTSCLYDNNDVALPGVEFTTTQGYVTTSDQNGNYTLLHGGAGNMVVQVFQPSGYLKLCPNSNFLQFNITNPGGAISINDLPFTLPRIDTTVIGVQEWESNISIYPNPATDRLFINADKQIGSIQMVDLLGKLQLTESVNTQATVLNVNALANGAYILLVTGASGAVHTQMIHIAK